MNLFNKREIKYLESQIKSLWLSLVEKEKAIKELREEKCFEVGQSVPEYSYIHILLRELCAIKKYLGIEVKWDWEDDPSYLKIEQPRMRVWKAYKIKK